MQQTETYKLNLIESSDKFLPTALNENAQKLEAALRDGLEAVRTETTTAEEALDARVTVLETHKIVIGTATAESEIESLGFTPKILFVRWSNSADFTIEGFLGTYLRIVEGGFRHSGPFERCDYAALV